MGHPVRPTEIRQLILRCIHTHTHLHSHKGGIDDLWWFRVLTAWLAAQPEWQRALPSYASAAAIRRRGPLDPNRMVSV